MSGMSNAVRQGSVLSPILLHFSMNSLSEQLKMCKAGCVVGGTALNHLMYADDGVLLSPSSAGLQQLLHLRFKNGETQDIKCKNSKSVIMISRTIEDRWLVFPDFKLPGERSWSCDHRRAHCKI